jgi:hypothetical protein
MFVSTGRPAVGQYVRVQLLFEGGPWADQLLDTEVTAAPEFIAPHDEEAGVYWRTGHVSGSSVIGYQWSPDGSAITRRTSLGSRIVERVGMIGAAKARFRRSRRSTIRGG